MIKFIAEKDGRPMLGLGLSRANCKKLLEGKPIFIDLKVMAFESQRDFNEATILIFGGETEESMCGDLERFGAELPEKRRTHSEEN